MAILETTLLFTAILVSAVSVFFLRSSVQKNQNAGRKLRDAEQKYRQEREARDSAEDALHRAENEHLESERGLQQAHDELQSAETIRKQAQDEIVGMARAKEQSEKERDAAQEEAGQANQRARNSEQARAVAEQQRDAAIKRAEEAEIDRNAAKEGVRQANERARLAEQAQKQTEHERDEVVRAHAAAILAKTDAETNRDEAIKRTEQVAKERDVAFEQARLANERAQRAEELQKQAEKECDDAKKQAWLADERAEKATERAEKAEKEVEELKKASTSTTVVSPEPSPIPELPSEQETRSNEHVPSNDDGGRESTKRTAPIEDHKGARSSEPHFHTASTPRSPKPEVVCVQKQSEWILKIELPQELLNGYSDLQVFQNELQLDGVDGYWKLNDACGNLVMRSDEGIVWQTDLGERAEQPLLFKLSGDREQGRRVRAVTQGWYLLIVPEDWKHAGFEPEFVSINRYHAYCRFVDDCREISFQTANGKALDITPRTAQFEWTENPLNDANESQGPLFGNTLPHIRATNLNLWEKVKAIIVGEEGRERGNWQSIPITPDASKIEQELPSEIAQWQASWFFVRFYDANDELIESTDFRLARGVSSIQINQSSLFPTENGHSSTLVEFHHTADCTIEPPFGLETAYSNGTAIAEIPPSAAFDKTSWNITTQGHDPIQATILVERIWWAIGTKDKPPSDSEWNDKPLSLTRADFSAISNKALWIRLPRPRWADEIQVGFAQETARSFPVKVTEQTVSIPLCDFCDSGSLRQIVSSPFVIRVGNSDTTLAHMRVQAKCMDCGLLVDSERDILGHVGEQHLNTAFRRLEYDELRKQMPSLLLPAVIFECFYCHQYVTDEPENSTTLYYHIIRRKCPEIPPGLERPPARQRRVTDIDEIRENVYKHLPDIRKCKFCEEQIEWRTSQQAMAHLIEKHRNELYELL